MNDRRHLQSTSTCRTDNKVLPRLVRLHSESSRLARIRTMIYSHSLNNLLKHRVKHRKFARKINIQGRCTPFSQLTRQAQCLLARVGIVKYSTRGHQFDLHPRQAQIGIVVSKCFPCAVMTIKRTVCITINKAWLTTFIFKGVGFKVYIKTPPPSLHAHKTCNTLYTTCNGFSKT